MENWEKYHVEQNVDLKKNSFQRGGASKTVTQEALFSI